MASTKEIMRIEGLRDLDKALSEFADDWGVKKVKPLLTRVLKKAGQPIANAESAYAPVGITGQLAESPKTSTQLTRRQKRMNPKESAVEVYIGPTPHPKSVQTEFGNAHQAAEPHLRPAWDGGWRAALTTITDLLAAEIEKTRARLAHKAEREAAKLKAGV